MWGERGKVWDFFWTSKWAGGGTSMKMFVKFMGRVGKIQDLKIQILVDQGSGLHRFGDTDSQSTFKCEFKSQWVLGKHAQ